METRARVTQITTAFPSRKTLLTLEIDASPAEAEKLQGTDLTAVLKPYRKRRSMNANAYYWVLCGKLAEVQRLSRTEMHNRLLAEYGSENLIDGVPEWSVKAPSFDWTRSEGAHYRPAGYSVHTKDGQELPIFWVIRGSHTYDSAEMARLIDGTVYEAKEAGIETLTPDELAQMKAAWKGR